MPTKKKRPYRRRKSKQSSIIRKWRKFKPKLFQKVGAITIFLIVLLGLFAVLFYKLSQVPPLVPESDVPSSSDIEVPQAQKEYFISQLVPSAQKLQREYGVFASVSLAQAALESNYGTSQLSAKYNNLFGVKTDMSDNQAVNLPTLEFIDGEMVERSERFKVYQSWEDSMRAHAELIYYGTSWNSEYYADVKNGQTYKEQAEGLQSAGYATDPDYTRKIIEMIETWELHQYDQPK